MGGKETVGHPLCDRREFISSVCFLRTPQESSIEYLIMRFVRNCLSVVVVVFCALEVGRGVGAGGVDDVAAFAYEEFGCVGHAGEFCCCCAFLLSGHLKDTAG